MSEVKRFGSIGALVKADADMLDRYRGMTAYVLASDYDALAAQRDEGLAREADLRADLARVQAESERQADMKEKNFWALIDSQTENSSLRSERETLQQCLAEAEKLLRDIENPFGDCKEISELKIREFLANHGCADGEKS